MPKPISPRQHIMTDYALGPLIAAAPGIVGFKDEETLATLLCRTIGGGIVAATSVTHAPGTLVPLVPFRLHLAGDVANGLFALSAPWLFGFADNRKARNTFLAMGVFSIVAGTMTRTTE